jgi:hypothetical protein
MANRASGAFVLAIAAAWWFGRALDRPAVNAPSRQGFDSTLLEGAISDRAVGASLINRDGFVHELDAPLHIIAGAQSA